MDLRKSRGLKRTKWLNGIGVRVDKKQKQREGVKRKICLLVLAYLFFFFFFYLPVYLSRSMKIEKGIFVKRDLASRDC